MPGTSLLRSTGLRYSNRPDPGVLSYLARLQTVALIVIWAIAAAVLGGWLLPALGGHLPAGWSQMKANTALLILLCGVSLTLLQNGRSQAFHRTGSALGLLVFLIGTLICVQFIGVQLLPIDTLLAPDPGGIVPGRMSLQASVVFMVMGLVLAGLRARDGALSWLVDLGSLLLGLFMLSFVGGLLLYQDAAGGRSLRLQLAPQSFVCLGLLTLLIFNRRSEYGLFSILVDAGVGGKTARLAAPVALLLPFCIQAMQQAVIRYGLLSLNYAVAVVPSLMSILAFYLILTLTRRSRQLENAARELSLLDELTRVYNRRGFMALGEQALRNATRRGEPFSVLFLDVDNLKLVNDRLGHDTGSELLRQVARLLRETFRESDVLGRLGGDEFVVAANAGADQMGRAIDRLELAVAAANAATGRQFEIAFSLGCVTQQDGKQSLEGLLERADERMYEAKRVKKSRQAQTA